MKRSIVVVGLMLVAGCSASPQARVTVTVTATQDASPTPTQAPTFDCSGAVCVPMGDTPPPVQPTAYAAVCGAQNSPGYLDCAGLGEPPQPTTDLVVYQVDGTAQNANITYTTDNNGIQQAFISVPLRSADDKTTGLPFTAASGTFLSISAQTQNAGGAAQTIVCHILVNGVEVVTHESQGEFVIASCSYTAP